MKRYYANLELPMVTLQLEGPCNYLCWYCVGERTSMAHPVPVMHDLPKLAKIYASLKRRIPVRTTMAAGGTEPALHPQIRQIVEMCTRFGSMEILTNLSRPVSEWLPGPTNCILRATIHPEAEKDVDGFLDRVREAQALGYELWILFDSTRIDTTDYQERLSALDIKLYPLKLRIAGSEFPQPETGILRAAGALCTAGYKTVFIRAATTLHRCSRNGLDLRYEPLSESTACVYSAECPVWRSPE